MAFVEWQSFYTRIPASTTYTITFPCRLFLFEFYYQMETTGVNLQFLDVIVDTGQGNSVPWVTSSFATFNYNAIRIAVGGPNLFRIKLNKNAYGIQFRTGTQPYNVNVNFAFNPEYGRDYAKHAGRKKLDFSSIVK